MRRFPRHEKLGLVRREFERCGIRDQHIRLELMNFTQAFGRVAGLTNDVNVRHVLQ